MLDAGKMAAGHWRLRPRSVDLVGWIEEIAELLAPRAQSKGLELAAYVAADVPARVEIDPEQLTRIVMNLAGNAIKFTERGGVTIEITAHTTAASTRLQVVVRDSGVGIAAEDQARIFGEYQQAKGTYVAGMPGTGLGLSIARDIATAMNAELTLDSAPGEGSQFTLALEVPVVEPGVQDRRPFAGRRFLIVSSSMIELSVLMRRLFDLGAQVDCASSLEAAREMIQPDAPFDAVLVDDGHEIDAIALLETCRDRGLATIALTTPAGRKRLDQLRALGLAGHLIKPIRTQTLQRILSKVVAGVRLDPVEAPPAAGPTEMALAAPPSVSCPKAGRSLRVLLADDNEINTLLAISMIGRQGHQIETAENGAIAIEAVRSAAARHPFDVILMDLHMPVVDGFEAIATIRADEGLSGQRATIIALTADSSDFTAQRALETGADLALTKPVQASRLADIFADIETGASGLNPRHRA
jgi:CheY-like chemotaxis protein/anti-sigma regulatory factor (Ser/Thr protein kinase)